jgi:hypothetical protein
MKRVFILLVVLLGLVAIFMPVTARAAEPFNAFEQTCDGDTANSSVCTEVSSSAGKNPFDGSSGIIPTVANFMAAVGGLIAVVIIMLSGLRLIMSSGDSAKLTQSRNAIIYAAAGIVVIVLARSILWFVISKL